MTPEFVEMSEEELAVVRPFAAACDERMRGYRDGMEDAKRMLVEQMVAARRGRAAATGEPGGDAPASTAPENVTRGQET